VALCTDGAAYLLDACLTLSAFVAVLPEAARKLLAPDAALLAALAALHDTLAPLLAGWAARTGGAGGAKVGSWLLF
jgi:hypothetical protein